MLGKETIKRYLASGHITIDPFKAENLGSSQYDVSLGEHCYRETTKSREIYNPYDEKQVRKKWEKDEAILHRDLVDDRGIEPLVNIRLDEKIILVMPGETILAHTQEFIGGSCNFITSMMKARSSMGRNFIEVCKCLPPETELRRANGTPITLGEVREGDRLLNVDRFGRARSATVKAIRRSGPKAMLRIETAGGRVLTCSTDHLLRVSRSDGLSTVEAVQVRVGDELPVLMRWEPGSEKTALTIEEATLLGYFVAEGNWSTYRLSFAKSVDKEDQRAQIRAAMKAVFKSAPPPHEDEYQLMYNSGDLAREFAQRYPETSCLGPEKRVPWDLFAASREAVRVFLDAYLRCDGHDRKSQNEVQTCSRSQDLIRDIALLAARVGAVPSFSQRIGGVADRMQFYGYYYGDDAGRIVNRITDAVRGQNVNIPDLLDQIRKKYGLTREMLQGYAPTDRKRISRKRLDRIVAEASVEIPELKPYVGDLAWDPVIKIEALAIEREGMIDISLDVESEEDSLFVLGDGLMVLNCAGMGDVGYFNRWTMEITNNSQHHMLPLVVGRRVGQILFFEVEPVLDADVYDKTGKYQVSSKIEELRASWSPEAMLPKQWKDRECR